MPIWMRKFHISRINEHIKAQNDAQEKSEGKSQMGSDRPMGPNVSKASTYNF
jgi:hypothetical protein